MSDRTPLLDASVWRPTLLCGAIGGGLALLLGFFSLGAFAGAGHGTTLIAQMFGVGLVAIPVAFAAAAVPKRYLLAALLGAILAVSLHWLVAWLVFHSEGLAQSSFRSMSGRAKQRARAFGVVVVLAEVVPVCIVVVRMWMGRRK